MKEKDPYEVLRLNPKRLKGRSDWAKAIILVSAYREAKYVLDNQDPYPRNLAALSSLQEALLSTFKGLHIQVQHLTKPKS
jgi:hypothetical protein